MKQDDKRTREEIERRIDQNAESSKRKARESEETRKLGGTSKKLNFDEGKRCEKTEREDPGRKETIKLAECLSGQIKVDQTLRQAKWEFGEYGASDKWDVLMRECRSKGIEVKN